VERVPRRAGSIPYAFIDAPRFEVEVDWSMSQLVDYMQTWSAYTRSRSDPAAAAAMDGLVTRTGALRESPRRLELRVPLRLLAGRIS
jgi:predicted aconitase